MIDSNPVFDSAFTLAAAPDKIALEATVDGTTTGSAPGETYTVNWSFTFTFNGGVYVKAPYRLWMSIDTKTGRS